MSVDEVLTELKNIKPSTDDQLLLHDYEVVKAFIEEMTEEEEEI